MASLHDKQPKCGSCYFCDHGTCRRWPPEGDPTGNFQHTRWRTVDVAVDWCGEHHSYHVYGDQVSVRRTFALEKVTYMR